MLLHMHGCHCRCMDAVADTLMPLQTHGCRSRCMDSIAEAWLP
jgi:hypothetical protein